MSLNLHELRGAWRRLATRPGYSALSVTILSLGLGAMLFMFGAVNGLILEPLPFPDSDRLVAIGALNDEDNGVDGLDSEDYPPLKEALRSYESVAVYSQMTLNLSRASGPKRYDGAAFSSEVLPMLGVQPVLGRAFTAADDQPGSPPAVLLGHATWRDDFGSDPAVLGQTLRVNGELGTVIGVMPENFGFPFREQVWMARRLKAGDDLGVNMMGLLKPDVTLQQARSELEAVAHRLGKSLEVHRDDGALVVKSLKFRLISEASQRLAGMMFAAGLLVLLLACANVGSLQLAQVLTRRRELAVRSALGAGRGQLLRELLAESLLLSVVATAIGLWLADSGGRWLMAVLLAAGDAPAYYVRFRVDARMVAIGGLAALVSTLLAGLVPALRASRPDVQDALRDGDKGASGSSFARLMRGLVVGEIALTVLLLVSAGMYLRGMQQMLEFDFGTRADPAHIATGRIALFAQQYPDGAAQVAFFERVVERLQADPQVQSASVASTLPGTMAGDLLPVNGAGEAKPAMGYRHALIGHVDDHFAQTYDVKLLAGRFFDGRDQADSARVAVIDTRLAEILWPGLDPIGRTLHTDPESDDQQALTVVGLVAAMHLEDPDDPIESTLLVPFRQHPKRFATVAVRTRDPAALFGPRLAEIVRSVDADTPVYWSQTQQKAIEMARIGPVVLAQIFSGVGLLALLLAAAGLYGVLAFAVEQRTREIGVRRAIGASRSGILRTVAQRLWWQVALGLVVGVALSIPWSGQLANNAFGAQANDIAIFGVVVAVIVVVALVASLVPMRRALRIDPMVALRRE